MYNYVRTIHPLIKYAKVFKCILIYLCILPLTHSIIKTTISNWPIWRFCTPVILQNRACKWWIAIFGCVRTTKKIKLKKNWFLWIGLVVPFSCFNTFVRVQTCRWFVCFYVRSFSFIFWLKLDYFFQEQEMKLFERMKCTEPISRYLSF